MTPKQVKRLVEARGWEFWYDPHLRLWTMTKEGEATCYFTAANLKPMTEAQFIAAYF